MKISALFLFFSLTLNCIGQFSEVASDTIFENANCSAKFPGGESELNKYLRDTFSYDDIDTTKFDYGTIYVTFFVEVDGSISGMDLINRNKESICKEDATPFKSMPNWKPASNEEGPIRKRVKIPIIIDP